MLGADGLALAALDAVGGLAGVPGHHLVVEVGVPVPEPLLVVHAGEQPGDADVHGTAVGAVVAGGAGDEIHAAEDLADPVHRRPLIVAEGLEIPHEAHVVGELGHVAHAGEHHAHLGEAGGEADGVAGVAAAVEGVEDRLGRVGQIHQIAALHRLHHDHRLAELLAHLVDLPALHRQILVVGVVELDLHHLDLGILGEDLLQDGGLVVEGDAYVADEALLLQGEGGLIGPAALELGEVAAALGVHQIEVEVVHAAGGQLAAEEGLDIRLGLEIGVGELVGEEKAVPGIAAGQRLPDGQLALAADVAVGGVEIVEAGVQEGVHHLLGLPDVHLFFDHGQAHHAEAEVAVDLRKEFVGHHRRFLRSLIPLYCKRAEGEKSTGKYGDGDSALRRGKRVSDG